MKTEMKELLGKEITKTEFVDTLGAEYANQWVNFCVANIEYKATAKVTKSPKVVTSTRVAKKGSRKNRRYTEYEMKALVEYTFHYNKNASRLDGEKLLEFCEKYDFNRNYALMTSQKITQMWDSSRAPGETMTTAAKFHPLFKQRLAELQAETL